MVKTSPGYIYNQAVGSDQFSTREAIHGTASRPSSHRITVNTTGIREGATSSRAAVLFPALLLFLRSSCEYAQIDQSPGWSYTARRNCSNMHTRDGTTTPTRTTIERTQVIAFIFVLICTQVLQLQHFICKPLNF